MGWRVVVAENRCKLEYKMGYLVCRGEETKKVFLDEIDTLIVESTAVAVTGVLLAELIKRKINVVFCDEYHNPHAQLNAIYGRHDCSGTVKEQLLWNNEIKAAVWAEIVKEKIRQQALLLRDVGSDKAELLESYIDGVEAGDATNREGHAAKVYFNALFGLDFKRGSDCKINALLNYGYAILLSAFNREVVSDGYITQSGIFHRNDFNYYNLSCDLMEPFRVIIDRLAFVRGEEVMDKELKHDIANVLNLRVKISDKHMTLSDAVSFYCKRIFKALTERDPSLIEFYEL